MNSRFVRPFVLASIIFGHGPSATRADPTTPAPASLATVVEGALGTDADASIRALELLAKRWSSDGVVLQVVVSTAITVLSREHWLAQPRGVDVRVKAIEVLGDCGTDASGVIGAVLRIAGAPGTDDRIRRAVVKARAQINEPSGATKDGSTRRAQIAKSIDNVRMMIQHFLGSGAGLEKPWPRYGGKRFVLWLVATNSLSKTDEKELEILFSPGDGTHSLVKAGGLKAFAEVTKQTLKDPAIDVTALTSYVGRRNDEKEHTLSAAELMKNATIIADLSFPGGVILGFASGAVRWVPAEELGLPPDQPIVVGDASPVEVLRHLSDR